MSAFLTLQWQIIDLFHFSQLNAEYLHGGMISNASGQRHYNPHQSLLLGWMSSLQDKGWGMVGPLQQHMSQEATQLGGKMVFDGI